MKKIGLLNTLLAATGMLDFGASRAIAEEARSGNTKHMVRVLWNPRTKGTLVTDAGKKRMAARKAAYKAQSVANSKLPARGKPAQRGVTLLVASGNYHCQYNKFGKLRELEKLLSM